MIIKFNNYTEDMLERIFSYATLYLENIQPITTDEGFIECFYEYDSYKKNILYVNFHFHIWTEEEYFEKFYDFLKNNKFKISKEYSTQNNQYIISIIINSSKIEEFSNIYQSITDYNL